MWRDKINKIWIFTRFYGKTKRSPNFAHNFVLLHFHEIFQYENTVNVLGFFNRFHCSLLKCKRKTIMIPNPIMHLMEKTNFSDWSIFHAFCLPGSVFLSAQAVHGSSSDQPLVRSRRCFDAPVIRPSFWVPAAVTQLYPLEQEKTRMMMPLKYWLLKTPLMGPINP